MTETGRQDTPRTGLVLSGGGAKGAYQIGVVKALLKLDAKIDLISGASIGALNGAVLACSPCLSEGVERLETLWNKLAESSPMRPAYLNLLLNTSLLLGISSIAQSKILSLAGKLFTTGGMPGLDNAMLSDEPLQVLLDQYLDIDAMQSGLPLYISVYRGQGGLYDMLRIAVAETGILDTPASEFIHLQSLPKDVQRYALLASAALPLLFKPREIEGKVYCDGGLGGWQSNQGNTPVAPLIEAGCQQVIVTHLSEGSLWRRQDFPSATILEIRPEKPFAAEPGLLGDAKAMFGFDAESIYRLIQQGFDDTLRCVGRVMESVQAYQSMSQSREVLNNSLVEGDAFDKVLAASMSRLR